MSFNMRQSFFAFLLFFIAIATCLPASPLDDLHPRNIEKRQQNTKTKYFDPAKTPTTISGSPATTTYSLTWSVTEEVYDPTYAPYVSKVMIKVKDESSTVYKYPPPPIKVSKNSIIHLTVKNIGVAEGISVHAHGLYQADKPWMDGPVGVTQKDIPEGKQFTYKWKIGEQVGTYWLHSHVTGQYPKGLKSPLVITDGTIENEESDYGGDRVITLTDWYNRPNTDVDDLFTNGDCGSGTNYKGIPVSPDDAIINDNKNTKTKIVVQKDNNKKIRLRFINQSAYSSFFVYIRGRVDKAAIPEMTVIEVDGVKTSPRSFKVIRVHPGQRYSVLFDPRVVSEQGYAIMAVIDPHEYKAMQIENSNKASTLCTPGIPFVNQDALKYSILYDWAFIDYETTSGSTADPNWQPVVDFMTVDPTKTFTPSWVYYQNPGSQYNQYRLCFPFLPNRICLYHPEPWYAYDSFDEQSIEPLPTKSAPPRPNQNNGVFEITVTNVGQGQGGLKVGSAAAAAYTNVSGRTVLDLVKSQALTSTWAQQQNTFDVGATERDIWIVLKSEVGGHPFHLHGHHFQVIYASGESTNAQTFNYNSVPVPKANPLRRDTIWLHRNEIMVLAVRLDNPGVWFFHCHNDFHAMGGMAAQMIERQGDLRTQKINPLTGPDLNDYNTLQQITGFPWSDAT